MSYGTHYAKFNDLSKSKLWLNFVTLVSLCYMFLCSLFSGYKLSDFLAINKIISLKKHELSEKTNICVGYALGM